MDYLSLLHIALIYLAVINVVTFFMYGIIIIEYPDTEGEHYDYLARITKK